MTLQEQVNLLNDKFPLGSLVCFALDNKFAHFFKVINPFRIDNAISALVIDNSQPLSTYDGRLYIRGNDIVIFESALNKWKFSEISLREFAEIVVMGNESILQQIILRVLNEKPLLHQSISQDFIVTRTYPNANREYETQSALNTVVLEIETTHTPLPSAFFDELNLLLQKHTK
jgi:hypothetical protein